MAALASFPDNQLLYVADNYCEYETSFDDSKRLRVGDYFDAKRYLFPCPQRDYLIGRNESGSEEILGPECLDGKTYVVICSFYIPVLKDDNVASTCSDIQHIFNELVDENHDDFVVVLVTRMRSDVPNCYSQQVARNAFDHFLSAFSSLFVAVPILDLKRSHDLFELTDTSSYDSPGCVIADLKMQWVSHIGFQHFRIHGADFFPFTRKRLEEIDEQIEDAMRSGRMPLSTFLRHQSSDVLHCEAHFAKVPSCGKAKSLSSLANKVVWLYYLHDGSFMDQLIDLYKKCKDDKEKSGFEIIVVRTKKYRVSCEKHVDSQLQHPDCCGWLHLPFDDRAIRRMYNLCHFVGQDRLVVVGPNTSYVDPDGREVFREYGIDAYPFSKQTVWFKKVEKLRNVRLAHWLGSCDINTLMKSNGEIIPVSDLEGANVLVFFGTTTLSGKLSFDWDGDLYEWIKEMKAASETRLEVILVSSGKLNDADCLKGMKQLCSKTGWLLPLPYECHRNATLHRLLYQTVVDGFCTLAAFGPNGNLLRLGLEDSLQERESGLATFPEDEDLPTDVWVQLNSEFKSIWCTEALKFSEWREY